MEQPITLSKKVQRDLSFYDSDLFKDVQTRSIFADSKTFADAEAKRPISSILQHYQELRSGLGDKELREFVTDNFVITNEGDISTGQPNKNINEQIVTLWQTLTKPADNESECSLLPLKGSYIVPGGRFREIYYWDSYFTALGLIESGNVTLTKSILDNFLDLQQHYGCIPNGNRSYYLSRSQPPVLGLMVELVLPYESDIQWYLTHYVKAIETEYHYWMQGADEFTESNSEHERVVKMPDGSFLNRYWDDCIKPRPESYKEDIELFELSGSTDSANFYRNIRAACESGWDFSSRWFDDECSLSTICTTRIIPIDLNCLLYKTEMLLSQFYGTLNKHDSASIYLNKASKRSAAINKYLWNESQAFFMDYHIDRAATTNVKSLAGILPLFVEIADLQQVQKITKQVEEQFLQSGGLITTCNVSKQQWDSPNGWAPLHWFAVRSEEHTSELQSRL